METLKASPHTRFRWQRLGKERKVRRGGRGLRKPSPELIAQAQDQTAATITRIMLTFVGLALFCVLALLTPDAALLTGGERLNVPLAGPVSFRGFMLLGPAILIALRIYLQIYVEHWRRLEPIRRRLPGPRVPTLAPLQNPLLRGSAAFVLYLLLPLTMLAFTWKAAVVPAWGSGLFAATVGIAAGHLMLPLRRPWQARVLLAVSATVLAAAAVYSGPLSRPANLFRADLSHQWLREINLQRANLRDANLEAADLYMAELLGANLFRANLEGANLARANLADSNLAYANLAHASLIQANVARATLYGAVLANAKLEEAYLYGAQLMGANLFRADLEGANLEGARLTNFEYGGPANLEGANLEGANLEGANLEGAMNLIQMQVDRTCGDETTKLPEELSIRQCAK